MPELWLSVADYEMLTREATRTYPSETGGVLLGYRGSGETIVITAIIGPGLQAVHAPFFYLPDYDFHEREVARQYEESGRRWTYLGDWHSHPGGSTHLSTTDRRTLRGIAAAPEARIAQPLMLIVGGQPNAWSITAHRLRRKCWLWRTQVLDILTHG